MTSGARRCGNHVRLAGKAAAVVSLFLAMPSPASDRPPPPEFTAGDLAALQRKAYQGAVVQAMRLKRFVSIGRLCGVLPADDAATIERNADALIDDERALLAPGDSDWARAYRDGVSDGAFRSASPFDVKNDEACRRFAAPGGTLAKIRTWTGKPVEEGGVLLSPRTIP